MALASLAVTVALWRIILSNRQQMFDRGRIRQRWVNASWGRRIATVLAVPVGVILAYVLIDARRSGALPESVVRLIGILLIAFAVYRLSKTMREERERDEG
jgi:hypothetical protein